MARQDARPFVSLLSDFGLRDPSAGIMRSVIAAIAPDALVIDITHDIAKFAVRDGALMLWCAVPYTPIGAHVAVVDPGVGTARRGVALETLRGDYLVGPDNGLLLPAAGRLGGVVRAHVLENAQYRLPVVSSSFHGRDIFAPAGAHLAVGVPIDFMGPPIDPRALVLLDWPEPEVYDNLLRTSVLYVDTFGNVKLSALGSHMVNAFSMLTPGERIWMRVDDGRQERDLNLTWVGTFGNVRPGDPLLYDDSYGRVCIAVNQGSAVRQLGLGRDMRITFTRVPLPRTRVVVMPPPARALPGPMAPVPPSSPGAAASDGMRPPAAGAPQLPPVTPAPPGGVAQPPTARTSDPADIPEPPG
jgi:S-adenosylmethionine hydrolase